MNEIFSQRLNSRYFHNKRGGFFIEAGAMTGMFHSVCVWFEKNLGWQGINIEPNPSLFIKLMKNRPKGINIERALSNKVDKIDLVVPIRPNNTEMKGHGTIAEKRAKNFIASRRTNKYLVETDTYTNIITRHKVSAVDLFVLDVEGHELVVLGDFQNCKVLPRILAVETNKAGKGKVSKLLKQFGYVLDWYDKYDSYFVRSI
jgi:FkbM family methyltransferase